MEAGSPAAPRAAGARVLIVAARYYPAIVDALIDGAAAEVAQAGAKSVMIEAAGALEIPGAIAMAHASAPFDAYVALGCVIRGETSHYDTVCNESARGVMQLTLQGLAVGNGVLTVENEAQALARAQPGGRNKGKEAAAAALSLLALRLRLAKGPL